MKAKIEATVVFYKSALPSDLLFAWVLQEGDSIERWKSRNEGYVYLSHQDIEIDGYSPKEAEISALESQREKLSEELRSQLSDIDRRIASLKGRGAKATGADHE